MNELMKQLSKKSKELQEIMVLPYTSVIESKIMSLQNDIDSILKSMQLAK